MLTALTNAASNILQRIANKDEPEERQMSPRLVWSLLHRPVWLAGFGTIVAAFLLQAGALRFGQLATVQPIVVLELPLTLIGASVVLHSPLHRREWSAVVLMSAGLGVMIAFLSPQGGRGGTSSLAWWVGVGSCTAGIAVALAASRHWPGARRAALIGAATGIAFGLTAAFTKGAMEALSGGVAALFTAWPTYAMVVSGVLAMFLMQNALQAGRLVAAQPGISLLDPFVSILWGVLAFHEHTHHGPLLVVAGFGGALMVVGAMLLSGSPLLEETAGTSRAGDRQALP